MFKKLYLILCEICESFAVKVGLIEKMQAHRKKCDGQVKEIRIVKRADEEEEDV